MKLETVDVDCLVIGAGVAGLAVAREISCFYSDVVIVEKNNIIGGEVSSRNSEVIHAGLYYTQGSLKHKLMIDGKERIYQFLKDRNIPYRRCGKYIISVNDSETERLRAISSNAKACGVMDTFFDTETFKKLTDAWTPSMWKKILRDTKTAPAWVNDIILKITTLLHI